MPNIVRMETGNGVTFEAITNDFSWEIGVTTYQVQFMMNHQLKGRSDMIAERASGNVRTRYAHNFRRFTNLLPLKSCLTYLYLVIQR